MDISYPIFSWPIFKNLAFEVHGSSGYIIFQGRSECQPSQVRELEAKNPGDSCEGNHGNSTVVQKGLEFESWPC